MENPETQQRTVADEQSATPEAEGVAKVATREAETPAPQQSAAPEAEAVQPGLDYSDPATAEYARTLDSATRARVDTVSRLLGKRVRFAKSVGAAELVADLTTTGN